MHNIDIFSLFQSKNNAPHFIMINLHLFRIMLCCSDHAWIWIIITVFIFRHLHQKFKGVKQAKTEVVQASCGQHFSFSSTAQTPGTQDKHSLDSGGVNISSGCMFCTNFTLGLMSAWFHKFTMC